MRIAENEMNSAALRTGPGRCGSAKLCLPQMITGFLRERTPSSTGVAFMSGGAVRAGVVCDRCTEYR